MISLGILEHLKGGADQLLGEVQRGSFHKLQTVLIHEDAHSSLLKNSESKAEQNRLDQINTETIWKMRRPV